MSDVVPFLHAADARASAEWWARLGFEVEWEHRFGPAFPLFLALRRGDSRIFLSEHRGDARPDALLYLYVDDADAVAADFGVSDVYDAPWGMRELELRDPDGNRVRVGSPLSG